jgi:hypothetical protein
VPAKPPQPGYGWAPRYDARRWEDDRPFMEPVRKLLVAVQWPEGGRSRLEGSRCYVGAHTQLPEMHSELPFGMDVAVFQQPVARIHLVIESSRAIDGGLLWTPKERAEWPPQT